MKSKTINFTKMHGLGNDFVVIDHIKQAFDIKKLAIPELSQRQMGIGFDQLLFVQRSIHADYFCRIFNADGSEARQCGNGLRCVARFIQEEKLNTQASFLLETKAGIYPVRIEDYAHIHTTMGVPQIEVPLIQLPKQAGATLPAMSVISVGNPHAILKVDTLDMLQAEKMIPSISALSYFPDGVNIGFMQILNPHHIRLRTFERGVGETNACGSNACAAVVAGIQNAWLHSPVKVEYRYGCLLIEWEGNDKPIQMVGPAERVFNGKINIAE